MERPKTLSCTVPSCGRPHYAAGLCQSHHRQRQTTGQLVPIRPYRCKREAVRRKINGLSVTPGCAEALERLAAERGLSRNAAVVDVLEAWFASGAKPPGENP